MTRVLVPATLVVVLVLGYAIVNGLNRSGEPVQRMVLTERELSLSSNTSADANRGLQLRLEIEHRSDPLDARNWLPEDRLRAIGFALHIPPGSPEAERAYSRAIPRIAWVAFELGGPAWRAIDERRKLQQSSGPWRGNGIESTRLVPVDAGPDEDALRARYPEGHLIVRATVVLNYLPPPRGPLVYGSIREVHPSAITVPRSLRAVLEGMSALPPRAAAPMDIDGKPRHGEPMPPRFEVEIAVGRLGVPYVTAIRRLNTL